MKLLHRSKALAAYEGARLAIKNNMSYPAYMMLKEAARGVLSYMVEDAFDKDISEKTKLQRLLEFLDVDAIKPETVEAINILIEAEDGGLTSILSLDKDDLNKVKREIKQLIIKYLKEPV